MTTQQVNDSAYEAECSDGSNVAPAEVAFGEMGDEALQQVAGGSFWGDVASTAEKLKDAGGTMLSTAHNAGAI